MTEKKKENTNIQEHKYSIPVTHIFKEVKKVQICCSAAQNINTSVKNSTKLGKSAANEEKQFCPVRLY